MRCKFMQETAKSKMEGRMKALVIKSDAAMNKALFSSYFYFYFRSPHQYA